MDEQNSNTFLFYISDEGVPNNKEFKIMNLSTEGVKEVKIHDLPGNYELHQPVWSKSANLFFISIIIDGNSDIYSFDWNGSKLKNLTNTVDIYEENPTPSPNGKWIAYEGYNVKPDIWLMSVNGKNKVNLTSEYPTSHSPVWANNSEYLYFSSLKEGTPNIYRMNIDDREIINISKGVGQDGAFSISTDSMKVAFDSDRDGLMDIFLYDEELQTIENLTQHNSRDTEPHFSPDNNYVVFYSNRDEGWDYYLLELKTKNTKRLTNFPENSKSNLTWSNDSRYIFFNMMLDGQLDIFSININNNEIKNFTNSPYNEYAPQIISID
jgi:Tol biopolymer transport system component